jgi:hypothetical protein
MLLGVGRLKRKLNRSVQINKVQITVNLYIAMGPDAPYFMILLIK